MARDRIDDLVHEIILLRTALAQAEAEKAEKQAKLIDQDQENSTLALANRALRAELAATRAVISALERQMVGTKMACDAIVQSKHAELAAVKDGAAEFERVAGEEYDKLHAELAAARETLEGVAASIGNHWAAKAIRTAFQVQPKGQGEETK